ncbi:hypothetical protein [Polynucleobacter sp. MWH-UH2A]|uniref:hypothetical protein n=1 Tax=Polynucleobacter sp. MWH-UH2A TaxID=1855617 RepID=UPI001BFEE2A8|nr:hypothetical protein [Polynucleobacter sp. MWH-UH2A]QWD64353.1 hypothetical protein IC571_01610 [Polynucleobacter sp. MWH-UH2A]
MNAITSTDSSAPGKEMLLAYALIAISSILLGIWALKHTIALRNILLVSGAVISIFYLWLQWKLGQLKEILFSQNALPLVLLMAMFVWVLLHYVFFSRYPAEELNELTSTWLRSALAVFLAIGTAMALSKKPAGMIYLWAGILLSFAFLLLQYIPKALAAHSFFAPEYVGSYIYHVKINGVLVGSVMVAGLTASILLFLRLNDPVSLGRVALIWLVAIVVALYVYVFVFEARNGIGLTVLTLGFALCWLILGMVGRKNSAALPRKSLLKLMVVFLLVLMLALGFGKIQASKNSGWQTLFQDMRIAMRIHDYPNWRDPAVLGYPISASGSVVAANTYERTAWATAGILMFIPENPLGIGVLSRSFPRLLQEKFGKNVDYIPSTHSAWVDLTLSYGIPGIGMMLGPLLLLLYRALSGRDAVDGFVFVLSASICALYTVGELSVQHGVEILVYLIAFLATVSQLGSQIESNAKLTQLKL